MLNYAVDDTAHHPEKENTYTTEGKKPKKAPRHPSTRCPNASQHSSAEVRGAFPTTPAGRVPLADLISNHEDLPEQLPLLTPVERVLWNYSPQSTGFPSTMMTPIGKRGTKRARSSSPTSSPHENSAAALISPGKKASFDLEGVHKSLKTPQADPAGDLWTRYSINSVAGKHTPSKSLAVLPTTFFQSSSPQTPAGQHSAIESSNCLRRTMSCGVAWPTSASKRRKIQKTYSLTAEKGVAVNSDLKVSKVNFLLERIQHGLGSYPHQPAQPLLSKSSSPPAKDSDEVGPPSSLLQKLGENLIEEPPDVAEIRKSTQDATLSQPCSGDKIGQAGEKGIPPDKVFSSDYGDEGFDDNELLETVDATARSSKVSGSIAKSHHEHSSNQTTTRGKQLENTKSGLAIPKIMGTRNHGVDGIGLGSHHAMKQRSTQHAELKTTSEMDKCEDEFDDGNDDELFDACLEDIAAMYDQHSTPKINKNQIVEVDLIGISHRESPPIFSTTNDGIRPTDESGMGKEVIDLMSDDEFGDGFDFADIADEYALATQGTRNERQISTIQRYLILEILEAQYETESGLQRPEKVMLVEEEKTKVNKAVTLRQSWLDSPCTTGSYIHVLGTFDKSGQCIIDDAHNILILHPDHLISATVVADSFSCTRRAVLQDRVKATNESNEPQVYGHILHEIFQEALKANRWDTEWLITTITAIASRYLETLFEINVAMTNAIEHLTSKVPEIQSWAEIFVTARPRRNAVVKDRNGAQALMCVNKLLDVEEHVWSPMYGLKGNVDATVQVVMRDGEDEKTLTVPFEVKTGKNTSNAAHKAQTALYTLLLSDRYDVQVAYGILYYMETSETTRIPFVRHEIRHMIMQRNELACYVRHRLELPPMLKSPHLCGKCYAKTPCFIYHKLVDNGDGETSGMKEKFDDLVKHLKPIHQDFFKKWDDLLTKEEADVLKFRRELWTMLSSEREKVGRCFGNIVIEPGSAIELTDAPKINRFRYSFVKQNAVSAFSFMDSQITIGEPIVISDEKGHFALANGYVAHVRKNRITVAVDRRLHNARVRGGGFNAQSNQTFTGIMEIVENGKQQSTLTPKDSEEQMLYRLDKDEFSNGMATARNNLIRVMEKDLFGSQALRKLVVEGVAPSFVPNPPMKFNTASQSSLNIDQKNAIQKVMSAREYALVLGMPGTGKTTTIAHIIRALVAKGKSVLLTSYTHTAVDNILLKIRSDKIGILRLGAVAKIHPEIQEFADLAGLPKTNVADLKRSYVRQVVATTCLGINHPIFNQRIFDYCIVDEASQITLPVCLGPIRMARTFILVGDHFQLPPLVQNKEAQEGGLDISLFKLLSEKHPASVVNLEHQYRMCADIMSLSNTLIYSGRLKCGTPAIANQSITIPNMSALRLHHHSPSSLLMSLSSFCSGPTRSACWLRGVLDPTVKVAFLNTDNLLPLSREIAKGPRITNPVEATLTTQLVQALLTVGVSATEIGVITVYRSQLALLKQNLRSHRYGTASHSTGPAHDHAAGAVEMHTADKFQGRDKDVVILSLVRSNDAANVGDLLKDWRRVNVALTRARTKLLIIGSWETVKRGNQLLGQFCELVDQRGWKVDLPVGVMEAHLFEEVLTQTGRAVDVCEERNEIENAKRDYPNVSENVVRKRSGGMRVPEKRGKLDMSNLLGKRPVMRDIVNEAMA